jgi:hypothetical protein
MSFEKARYQFPVKLLNNDFRNKERNEENDYLYRINPKLVEFKADTQKVEALLQQFRPKRNKKN